MRSYNSRVSDSSSASPRENRELISYWRASEARETLSGVYKFELVRYIYIFIPHYITFNVRDWSKSVD